jgi:hypothetical protein
MEVKYIFLYDRHNTVMAEIMDAYVLAGLKKSGLIVEGYHVIDNIAYYCQKLFDYGDLINNRFGLTMNNEKLRFSSGHLLMAGFNEELKESFKKIKKFKKIGRKKK